MQTDQSKRSLDEMWSLLQDQQREIDELRSLNCRGAHARPRSDGHGRPVSRAGMLKAAALGVAGVAGAGALLSEQGGTARAALGEGQSSFSSASTPTVQITNTSTGKALTVIGNGPTIAEVDNSSTAASAVALYGVMTSGASGSSSAGVRGYNASTSAPGIGVYGNAPNGYGVYGTSTTRYGVFGGSNNNIGFFGVNFNGGANLAGVQGVSNPTTPANLASGIRGISNGTGANGVGVYGSQAGTGWGVYGTAGGIGVYGVSTAGSGVAGSSTSGAGVYGSSTNGLGVQGQSASTNANASAVQGLISSTTPGSNSSGVFGLNNGTGANGIGVWGSQAGTGMGVYGSVTGKGYGVAGNAPTGGGFAIYAQGDTGATGTKNALIRFDDGKVRKFYCMESPECWFEDFGASVLRNGRARVKLDRKFAQSVMLEGYHVFLTPRGDSKGLYISEQGPDGFVVREQEGGRANIQFSYRIVALRKDVNAPRLQVAELPALPGAPERVEPAKPAKHMQKTTGQSLHFVVPRLDLSDEG